MNRKSVFCLVKLSCRIVIGVKIVSGIDNSNSHILFFPIQAKTKLLQRIGIQNGAADDTLLSRKQRIIFCQHSLHCRIARLSAESDPCVDVLCVLKAEKGRVCQQLIQGPKQFDIGIQIFYCFIGRMNQR